MIIKEQCALAHGHGDTIKAWEIQPSESQWPSSNHVLMVDEVAKW